MDERIAACAEAAISGKIFPGCVIGYVRTDGARRVLPFGRFTYEPDAAAVREDTIYDLASITKSIPTASLALQFIDEGRLRIDGKLIDYLPEFSNSDRENVLIKHLLTYTIDGYGLASTLDGKDRASLHERTAAELEQLLLTHNFQNRPGTVFKYTNIPAALLGLAIERITGETLDVLAAARFFEPLGMHETTFYPERFPAERIVPTEIDAWREEVRGVVHDESAYIAKRDHRIFGHAGLFSKADDILTFLEMLLNDGTLTGRTFFSEGVLSEMETNQIPELGDSTGLGWELNQPRYMGANCTERTFGKTGFTGTLCVVDRGKGVAYVLFSNRIYPHRPKDSAGINKVRAEVGEILLSS